MRSASSLSKGFNYVKCLRFTRSEIDLDEAKQKKIEEEATPKRGEGNEK